MSLARDVTTVGSATLTSRLLGFARDMGIAAILGAGAQSDAYFAASQLANLFRRLLAEGALNSAFVPMWLRIRDERGPDGARQFAQGVLGSIAIALGVLAVGCIVFAPVLIRILAPGFAAGAERFALAVAFVRLSAPYVACAGLVAVAASILNAQGRVAAAAFGVIAFNCVFIAAVLLVLVSGAGVLEHAGAIFSASFTVAGLVQLLVVGVALLQLPDRPHALAASFDPDTRRFYAQAVPGVVAAGIPQLKFIAGAMVASSSPAAVSWLYYASRLYELPLGVVSVAVASVMAPRIAASLMADDRQLFAQEQSRAFEVAVGLALPAAIGLAVLSDLIAAALFERGAFGPRDTEAVAAALAAIAAGLPGHVLEKVFGAVSFAHADTRTPMYAAFCGLAVAIAGALLLFPAYRHVGIAAAIAASGWIGAGVLAAILARRGWIALDAAAMRRLPRIVLAAMIMGAVLAAGHLLAAHYAGAGQTARIAALAVLVAAGLAVYVASLQALGVARIREIAAAVRHRL